MSKKIIATINSTGRQSASFIRVASAVGWHVRAQVRANEGLVAEELASLPNVELIEGDLTGPDLKPLLKRLFDGARVAFINTTHWGDEVAIGKACADAAKKAHIAHYVYSSMPDHSVYGEDWRALPLWASKFAIENYVRQIDIPATFIYTGIYNNNFTSLPYPCFQMAASYGRHLSIRTSHFLGWTQSTMLDQRSYKFSRWAQIIGKARGKFS
jgi:uncharacterized protein YbjT (DUF2867 family)